MRSFELGELVLCWHPVRGPVQVVGRGYTTVELAKAHGEREYEQRMKEAPRSQ